MWAGLGLYALNFFVWVAILSQLELSVAVPMTSLNYVILALMAVFILHEKISLLRWAGILLIVAGAYYVSRKQAAEPSAP